MRILLAATAAVVMAFAGHASANPNPPQRQAMVDLGFSLGVCHWRASAEQERATLADMAGKEPMSEAERELRAEVLKAYHDARASDVPITGPECDRLIRAARLNLARAQAA